MNFFGCKKSAGTFIPENWKQNNNRLDALKAQETTGKALVTFKITWVGKFVKKYEIFIDDKCVGVISKKE